MKLEWEEIAIHTYRLKVHGGWIVRYYHDGLVFVPDTHHCWEEKDRFKLKSVLPESA